MSEPLKMPWRQALLLISRSHLAKYVVAAILARIATGASAVSIILLAHSYGAEGKVVGALAACLTAPHILGPVYGRYLDKSLDPKKILAASCLLYTLGFQLALLGFQSQQLALTISSLLVCGICSSFMMGGLSSQLAHLVTDEQATQRRAQSYDTLTYGFGLTTGPLLIAMLSSSFSGEMAANLVMSLPLLAALVLLLLPTPTTITDNLHQSSLGYRDVVKIMWQSGRLQRTIFMTACASFSIAALPIMAVYLGERWQQNNTSGAYLVTLYGVGCVCGALVLMLRPMKAEAILLLRNIGLILLLSLVLIAISQSFVAGLFTYWLCGVVNSIFFAATLAARREYAPKQGAGQIYMWVAAAKISAASLGTFVAGLLLDQSATWSVTASSVVLALSLVICFARKTNA